VHEKDLVLAEFCVVKKRQHMQSSNPQIWGPRSLSYWLILPIALGIIYVGARFIVDPAVGGAGFGVPFANDHDIPYARIKGIRDIFAGLALLPLLMARMRKAAAWVFTSAIVVPATDFLIVLSTNGPSDTSHLLVHGLITVYMLFTSFLLFKHHQS
jgi:Domain of unknown function (DUF4267)